MEEHLERKHYGEKQICLHCNKEKRGILRLKKHTSKVHEKLPCELCGFLVAKSHVKRHFQSKHTPNDQKKFKCDVCGKDFPVKENLKDHSNIHTGEKPYKCIYCVKDFASKGTHAMHQRTHLGYRRVYLKKKYQLKGKKDIFLEF